MHYCPRANITFPVIRGFHPGDSAGFFETVKQIAATEVPAPKASPFRFEFSAEAAEHNTTVLERYDFDLATVIDDSPGSHNSYGSELRPPWQLEPLLRNHPSWLEFHDDMVYGIQYPFKEDIDEETRLSQLKSNMERGNHKSALKDDERQHVTKLMRTDVENGYAVPITAEGVRRLKDAEVYPVGLQDQNTIDERGNVIPKKRVTHDLSHNRKTGESVNQRVDMAQLKPAMYGHAMSRVLHLIHHIRRRHPGKRILCNKFDIDKAYRRLHTRASTAAKCIAMARARAHLLGGAVFFAMRSCEYTYVGTQDRKTRPIQVGDITFLLGNTVIPHSDPNHQLRRPEIGHQERRGDAVQQRRPGIQPRRPLGRDRPARPLLPQLPTLVGGLHILRRLRILTDHVIGNAHRHPSRSPSHRSPCPRLYKQRRRHPFRPLLLRHDGLPSQGTRLHDHADRPVELDRLPQLH